MAISIFDLFSIGIGPSSSHTVGPMSASYEFIKYLEPQLNTIDSIKITLYGSLAFTGKGHGTDKAVLMGLCGEEPETIDPNTVESQVQKIRETRQLNLLGKKSIAFNLDEQLIFNYKESFDYHPNAMRFDAYDKEKKLLKEAVYFSIGGGFIVNQANIDRLSHEKPVKLAYPFNSAAELLAHCEKNHLTIAQVMLENEKYWRTEAEIKKGILNITKIMQECINHGCHASGILPGALKVHRRAPALYQKLKVEGKPAPLHPRAMNWLNVYAMAVNEENAAGRRVVTAPTNGAAGIIPAVLQYYVDFCENSNDEGIIDYMLTAGAIGILYKKNASISGAEMGCQGEVGVACSMAAGGLAAALGGNVLQVENAAEIGMEHNLGLTCDPVGGLVQIPCIERNAMGTVKAVNAAQLALAEEGRHKVSLDMVIETMREIGHNMNSMYKETSKGGLAVAVNLSEC